MVNAVVMAGGSKRFSWRELYHQVEDLLAYREWYFRRGYKAAWRVSGYAGKGADSARVVRPMFEFMLERLHAVSQVDRVVVVGPTRALQESLEDRLGDYQKTEFVEQGDSFGENAVRGYEAAGRGKVLFCTADSPTTTPDDVREVLRYGTFLPEYDILVPLVSERVLKADRSPQRLADDHKAQTALSLNSKIVRGFFPVIPDSIIPSDYSKEDGFRDVYGREGVRVTSMLYGNIDGISAQVIDDFYSLRKMVRPSVRRRLRELLGPGFVQRTLGAGVLLSECAATLQSYLMQQTGREKRFGFVGLSQSSAEYDVDGASDVRPPTGAVFRRYLSPFSPKDQ